MKTFNNIEELKKEIFSNEIPEWSRKGQFVFNYMDKVYGVARAVQFEDRVDCFYADSKIDLFLEKCLERMQ